MSDQRAAARFDDAVVTGVLGHMNGDHLDDSLDIVRAAGHPTATSATMTDLDTEVGVWSAVVDGQEVEVRVPWPGGPLTERPQLRVAVVKIHEEAREKLGLPPVAPH
ncbi:DUF2470 domain-containing protein [Nocardioides daphniae]|uniref:DUF2470 domain-containing protein n=1 Tax=Nocardioides daphniae TaxID=402297 RepID=UPI001E594BA5|nr:DUF2470 domain-containing protein [Nocardioides daphniae]